jgi:hypothetical protein
MTSILLRNGYVVTVDPDRRVFPNGYVRVDGERIASVGPMDRLAPAVGGRSGSWAAVAIPFGPFRHVTPRFAGQTDKRPSAAPVAPVTRTTIRFIPQSLRCTICGEPSTSGWVATRSLRVSR